MTTRTREQIEADMAKLQREMRDLENNETVFTVGGRKVSRLVATNLFDMVADPTNWKNPIDKTVTIFDDFSLAVLPRAITFFVGSVPTIEKVGNHQYRVRAAGYYVSIGA